jgi:ribosomal protein S18 acetylase RimI-like enzyme
MATIRKVETQQELQDARELVSEYLGWVATRLAQELDIQVDVEDWVDETMAKMFQQPGSHVVLAYEGAEPAAMGCLRVIGDGMGEIKRMYTRPAFRRKGIATEVLEALLQEAGSRGHTRVRLDTAKFMTAAQSLYRSCGFHERAYYPESEVAPGS